MNIDEEAMTEPSIQWYIDAVKRVSEMDKTDRESGYLAPCDSGIIGLIKTIKAAMDCAFVEASKGDNAGARKTFEEAIAMASTITATLKSK